MPVTISGDGGIAGISSLGGGDFVAGSLAASGELIAAPQSLGRATLYVDSVNNCLSVNTVDAPPAGVRVQVKDETDPIISVNNTVNGEVRLGCRSAEGYIGTESNYPFVLTTGGTTKVHIATNGNVGINNTNPQDPLSITSNLSQNQIGLDTGDISQFGTLNIGHFNNGAFIGTVAGTNSAANTLRFGVSGSEEARITQRGNLLVAPDGLSGGQAGITLVRNKDLVFDPSDDNGQIGGGVEDTCTLCLRNDAANNNTGVGNFAQIMFDTGGIGQSICRIAAVRTGNSSNDLRFIVEGGNVKREAARFTSAGNLAFPNGQGIDFSAVTGGIGTVDNSLLDDYEEGIWTPEIYFNGTAFNGTFNEAPTGHYIKVGQIVHMWWGYRFSSLGTHPSDAALEIRNTPYSALYLGSYKHPVGSMIITEAAINNLVAMPFAAASNRINFRNAARSSSFSDDATVDISDLTNASSGFGSIILYAVS